MKKLFFVAGLSLLLAGCQSTNETAAPAPVAAPASPTASINSTDNFWPADGVFPAKGRTSSWSGFRASNAKHRTLFAQQREEDQDSIVFFGDSITEGWHTLKEDFAGLGVKVVNRGIGGDTTPNLLYRLEGDVLSLHPKAIVLLIGTNDLGEHTTPADIAANLDVFHDRVRAAYPKIPIAWCLVMPRKGDDTYPDRIRELNARIYELAASDHHLIVCDTFTPLAQADGSSKPEDFMADRIHPNAAGYAVWKSVLYPILARWDLNAAK